MLIRSFQKAEADGRVVPISHGKSTAVRVLMKDDGLGFSLSEARCGAGNKSKLWYKNHWEANYIRAGKGSLINTLSGESWPLHPGVLYCVGPNDQHSVVNSEDPLRIISIFNPPITGIESHDADGAYPATGEIPPGRDGMFWMDESDESLESRTKLFQDGAVKSIRMLTSDDRLGFSFNSVYLNQGVELDLWYRYHWEANLVLSGELEVTDISSGERHTITPGGVYCVGPEDRHHLLASSDVHLVAVFNPPLRGDEVHDSDGAYPASGPVPPGPA